MASRYLLEALERWSRDLAGKPAAPRGLFGFTSCVYLRKLPEGAWQYTNTPYLVWAQWEFDYEFIYNFTDSTVPDNGEFTIYNVTDATIARVAVGDHIECNGGYGDDRTWVFHGFITRIETKRKGADKLTTLTFVNRYNTVSGIDYAAAPGAGSGGARVSCTYAAGVSAGHILRDLCEKTGMPIAEFSLVSDRVFPEAVTVEGDLSGKIGEFAAMCGVWAFQAACVLHVKDLRQMPPMTFLLDEMHGLIGTPEPFEEAVRDARAGEAGDESAVYRGYNVKMLLNNRVSTGVGVMLSTKDVQGVFAVKSGRHVFNGLSATTEVKLVG